MKNICLATFLKMKQVAYLPLAFIKVKTVTKDPPALNTYRSHNSASGSRK